MGLTIAFAFATALCGVGVGILSAMFGIGGGIVMVPLLHIVFGLPAAAASGTSIFAILPTSLSGMAARFHDGTIRFREGLIIGVVGAVVSPAGAWASDALPGTYAMVLTGLIVLFTAYKMFKRVWLTRPQPAASQASGEAATAGGSASPAPKPAIRGLVDPETCGMPKLVLSCAGVGIVAGFLSGYLGLGGGFLVVPCLQWVLGFTMKQATGTSLVAVACLAVPSFITHALLGHVDWVAGLMLIVGSLLGTRLGARILAHVNDRLLTGLFGVMLLASGVLMVVRELLG